MHKHACPTRRVWWQVECHDVPHNCFARLACSGCIYRNLLNGCRGICRREVINVNLSVLERVWSREWCGVPGV